MLRPRHELWTCDDSVEGKYLSFIDSSLDLTVGVEGPSGWSRGKRSKYVRAHRRPRQHYRGRRVAMTRKTNRIHTKNVHRQTLLQRYVLYDLWSPKLLKPPVTVQIIPFSLSTLRDKFRLTVGWRVTGRRRYGAGFSLMRLVTTNSPSLASQISFITHEQIPQFKIRHHAKIALKFRCCSDIGIIERLRADLTAETNKDLHGP